MFVTAPAHKQLFIGALQSLMTALSLAFSLVQARAVGREEADLENMSSYVSDMLELPFGENCVTDWGLVERAARLRGGWA